MAGDVQRYHQIYNGWRQDPETFWREAAKDIDWFEPAEKIFDPDAGVYGRWFAGASCNACYNALDRHVATGRKDQAALIYDSPVTDTRRVLSYGELRDEVATLAAVLCDAGISKGDTVIIYMPMIPEAVMAMLACARIGAIHSVVFGGFAARELAIRIEDVGAKVVLTASCGIEPNRIVAYKPLLDQAIELSNVKPETCIVFQRPQAEASMVAGRDLDWAECVAAAKSEGKTAECVAVAATDPLYVLYTSGTTGIPKGVVRDTGGYITVLMWTMKNFYGIKPGEVFWTASDIGWVVGHSYIVYAPLLYGATTLLYEGKPVGTPDCAAYWRVISEHNVASLFSAPTALRAIRKEDPDGLMLSQYNLSGLRALFLAGERADSDTVQWAEKVLGVPVVDHWWQTETGWPIAGNPIGVERLPTKYGSTAFPMPGYNVDIVDEASQPVAANVMGTIAIKLPLPPGCLPTLWKADKRFKDGYLDQFPGYYTTSDAGFRDEDGYLYVMGRTDDVINVAGHRLSTGGIEEVLASHQAVAECAVIGVKDQLKGEVPCGFVVLKSGMVLPPDQIERELIALVRDRIGPVAAFRLALTVGRLPKTRSGKILRGTMKRIADGDSWSMPATIEDPSVMDEITEALQHRGMGQGPDISVSSS